MAGFDGLRVIGRGNSQDFETYSEVGDYLGQRLSGRFHVVKPFLPVVVGGLVEVHGIESIRLIGDGKVGVVPRSKSGEQEGVTASVASALEIDIISHVEPWDSELLDRGLAWVAVGAEAPPLLTFTIIPEHGVSAAEIAERLTTGEERAVAMINGVLDSNPQAPYSQNCGTDPA